MINLTGISKHYGRQVLLLGASSQLNPGEKLGLVGPNGSGKTTIFRLITGEVHPDDSDVSVPRRTSVGYFIHDSPERAE
jgi:ATPase subunit of ABC transporter with duplicated ATPase domains